MKLLSLFAVLSFIGLAPIASAQATRTWVSGVGDDANPGSRTAPCKTFAGAISKTADGGEINALDPAGFGGVTITKSITITGLGSEAGILVSGTNAVIINAADDDVVILRNINFEGLGNGTSPVGLAGVKILKAGAVYIENCRINGFTTGIEEVTTTTTGTQVYVKDTQILECKTAGISSTPAAAAASAFFIDRSRIEGCQAGISIADRGKVVLDEAIIANNVTHGVKQTGTGVIQSYRTNRIIGNTPDVIGKVTLLKLR